MTDFDSVAEISAAFAQRFADLAPKRVHEDEFGAVYSIDLRRLFRSFRQPVLIFLGTCARIVEGFKADADWFDNWWIDALASAQINPNLILFCIGAPGSKDAALRYLAGQVYFEGQPVLPLGPSLLGGKRDPRAVIKDIILKHAEPRHFQPYRIDEITPPEMFFGRNQLLTRLHSAKGSQVIVGPRRIGKSSLARRFQHFLGHVGRFEAAPEHQRMLRCSYVDVSELGEATSSTIWSKVLKNFNLGRKDYSAGGRITKVIRSNRRQDLQAIVDDGQALGATITAFRGQLSIVLDEVDKWIESEAHDGWPTLDRLRAMSDEGRAQVLLIGYESLALAAENDRFPFAGRGNRLHVGPLDYRDVVTLVKDPLEELGVRIDGEEQVLNRLWKTTSGMPHIVQDICSHLVDLAFHRSVSGKRVINPPMVEAAIHSSAAVKILRRGVINATLPLAEAIAGELSFADASAPARESRFAGEVDSATGQSLSVGAIATALEEAGYSYDSRDFERALAYLELRFIIRPADASRGRWMWTNDLARKTTKQYIENIGKSRWRQSIVVRHKEGDWRKRYDLLEQRARSRQ